MALGGTPLASFVQEYPFYTAQNVAVLRPLSDITFGEKLFTCLCIRRNQFRYSAFGREANRTLKELRVLEPSEFPGWVKAAGESGASEAAPSLHVPTSELGVAGWRPHRLDSLFDLAKGQRLRKDERKPGATPYIGALDRNNGLVGYIDRQPIHKAGTIAVNYNGIGGVAAAFYQPVAYWCSDDVNVLYPKFDLTPAVALFIATIICREKYRFSFGRRWHLEPMAASGIRLPTLIDGSPDCGFMGRYILTLPFSSQL